MLSLKILLMLAALAQPATLESQLADAAVPEVIAVDTGDLQDKLEVGLRIRRPQEFAFVALVVGKVEAGTLPRQLVEETFLWARKKQPYPYVYFERAMKIRAAKEGVDL